MNMDMIMKKMVIYNDDDGNDKMIMKMIMLRWEMKMKIKMERRWW